MPTPPPNAGRTYHVHEVLGRGGFGTVYRAEVASEGGFTKPVALKVLHPDAASRSDHLARLRDEARMLGLIRHRALVGADALVRLEDRWTVVMEFVPGVSLRALQKRFGAVPEGAVVTLGLEVADALDAAFHAELEPGRPLHLVHRDMKPSNLQLTDRGEVKVLDFGVARAEFDRREARTQQVVYGSPPYLSPERLEGVDTHHGDVFALGISMAELLTGRSAEPVAIKPAGHAARIAHLLEGLEVRPELLELLHRMLAYEHADRPDAAEVRDRLRPWSHADPDALRRYAAEYVPRELQARGETPGELSGRRLQEDTTSSPLQQLAAGSLITWDEEAVATEKDPAREAPPPTTDETSATWDVDIADLQLPTTATPTPSARLPTGRAPGRPLWQKLLVALLAFLAVGAAGLALLGVLGVGVMASAGWALLGFVDDRGCEGGVAQMELYVDRVRGDEPWIRKTRELLRRTETACASDAIGVVHTSLMATTLERATEDLRLDQRDFKTIEATMLRYLPSED